MIVDEVFVHVQVGFVVGVSVESEFCEVGCWICQLADVVLGLV